MSGSVHPELSCVCFTLAVQEAKTQLPLVVLKKVWGEAVSYICGLKEDYSRLFQGQRAAMWVTWQEQEAGRIVKTLLREKSQ